MSDRGDIETYHNSGGLDGLTYTCNCGWIDVNHTKNESTAPEIGATNLWNQIINEERKVTQNGVQGFVIKYGQDSARRIPFWGRQRFNDNISEIFIRSGLSHNQKEQVALSIFIEKSLGFEELQKRNFSWISNTGFSEEDLVSNILGFYNAVRKIEWRPLCKAVSLESSLKVWDNFIKPKGGLSQNKTFLPNFYQCDECPSAGLPAAFNSIQPIEKGVLHFDFEPNNSASSRVDFQDGLFNRRGEFFGLGFLDVPTSVKLMVNQNESEYFFCRRVLMQAGFLAGLNLMERLNYADKFYPLSRSFKEMSEFRMEWEVGDPSNDNDKTVKLDEFSALAGKISTYFLNPNEIKELKKIKANRFPPISSKK